MPPNAAIGEPNACPDEGLIFGLALALRQLPILVDQRMPAARYASEVPSKADHRLCGKQQGQLGQSFWRLGRTKGDSRMKYHVRVAAALAGAILTTMSAYADNLPPNVHFSVYPGDPKANGLRVVNEHNESAAWLGNINFTAIQGTEPGLTAWSVEFDVINNTQSTNKDRGDATFYLDFQTAQGGPVPMPSARIGIRGWQTSCHRGSEHHQVRDGVFNVPYETFVAFAASMSIRADTAAGPQGGC
jgi:hypothetical protein